MIKMSSEQRAVAVRRHFEGGESFSKIAKSLNVSPCTIRELCRNYESFGVDAFKTNRHEIYADDFKKEVVEYFLSEKASISEVCKKFAIPSTRTLKNWILLYNGHSLKVYPRGKSTMTKGRKTTQEERIRIVEECLKNGANYEATAKKHGVSYNQVYQWVRKYNERGVDGLIDRRGRTKSESEMNDIERLKAENRLLRAQLERKELENKFLKKLDEIERRRG